MQASRDISSWHAHMLCGVAQPAGPSRKREARVTVAHGGDGEGSCWCWLTRIKRDSRPSVTIVCFCITYEDPEDLRSPCTESVLRGKPAYCFICVKRH